MSSIGEEKLEERMDYILDQVDKRSTQYAILLTLMEICRQLERIWEET